MALSADELATIRGEIGSTEPPSDADLDEIFGRLGTTGAVVLEVLNGRLANMISGPNSVSIPGIYSESNGSSLQSLQKQIARLDVGGRKVATSRLVRVGRSRR